MTSGLRMPNPATTGRISILTSPISFRWLRIPHRVDTIKPVEALAGLPLDQVFVGTCTNGRYSDLARFARLVKGRRVAVRTIVIPASASVLGKAIRTGVLADIVEAGAPS